eukprot:10597965-Alexandrium_andersonii.AAC.1
MNPTALRCPSQRLSQHPPAWVAVQGKQQRNNGATRSVLLPLFRPLTHARGASPARTAPSGEPERRPERHLTRDRTCLGARKRSRLRWLHPLWQ